MINNLNLTWRRHANQLLKGANDSDVHLGNSNSILDLPITVASNNDADDQISENVSILCENEENTGEQTIVSDHERVLLRRSTRERKPVERLNL